MDAEIPASVSVTKPVGQAIEKVKMILFKPFDFEKWFVIGFCAWLAQLGKGGFGGGSNISQNKNQLHAQWHPFKYFVLAHLPLVITLATIIVILSIAVGLVLIWLRSRGKFMFLHCVAQNTAQVKAPWNQFRDQANSLFVFSVLLSLTWIICMILLCGVGFLITSSMAPFGPLAVIPTAILCALIITVTIIAFALTAKFTTDFVVPIMYLHSLSCLQAWAKFLTILSAEKATFLLYILFQIVIGFATAAIVLAAIFVTCCCAACFFAIPYIGTVLMLPIFVFKRSYSLCYFSQFGPQYNVFKSETVTS